MKKKYKGRSRSELPCARHTCRYHGERFEQSCSGDIGGEPAVIACHDYLLASSKQCRILPGPWDSLVEEYCNRNRHEHVCKKCSWLMPEEINKLPERSVYQEEKREI